MVYNQVGNLQVDYGGGVLDPLTPQKFLDHVDEPRLHGQVDHRLVKTDLEKIFVMVVITLIWSSA